jgi:uncharacterized membrane protein YkoI
MTTLKPSLLIGGLLLTVAVQSACTKNEQTGDAVKAPLSRAEAEQMALEKYPGSYLIGSEIEVDEGKTLYEIEVRASANVYELSLDPAAGEILETEDNTMDFQADSTAGKAPLWKVSLADRDAAEAAALQACPGQTQQWKAVTVAGREIFSFKIKNEAGEMKKIVVQAGTNEVLEVK